MSLSNISRASSTDKQESAARQLISFDVNCETLPKTEQLNANLPSHIKVFDLIQVDSDFSARRTCETRTFEYLVPSYAFALPSQATYYCYPEIKQEFELNHSSGPRGGLFKTLKRKKGEQPEVVEEKPELPPAPLEKQEKEYREQKVKEKSTAEKKNIFVRMFSNLCKPKKKSEGSEKLKASLNATLRRNQSLNRPEKQKEVDYSTTMARKQDEDNFFVATLKRSLSRKRVTQVMEEDVLEQEFEQGESAEPHYFDPLDIPPPTPEQAASIRGYRMPPNQLKTLNQILGLFHGTHNFHNYIPGAAQDDPRCFIRILNIEAAKPHLVSGVEWVRIKIQAKAFARYQIRRMMAIMMMVIRTNTRPSVLGNSFGYARIDIPEAPAFSLILDEPMYDQVSFTPYENQVQEFRQSHIHAPIYQLERDEMRFEEWLRSLDNYSFLYTYFLNERGVITKPVNFIRPVEQEN